MVKTFYLSNGLKVAMEYMPQYRSVSMGVWVKAGSVNENKQTNGTLGRMEGAAVFAAFS